MISVIEQTFSGIGLEAVKTQWRPNVEWKEKRKPSVWAVEERKLAPGQSPLSTGRTIKYDHAIMPHCVEQMDSADDPAIRIIALWGPIRDGKTNSTCLNIFGRTVTDDPGHVYSVHPTSDDAAKFSNDDIEGMIDACLGGYFVEKKSRDPGRTVNYKRYIGGSIRIASAGSVTKFRGTSVKVMLLHELDKLNPESIFQAFGRTTGFSDAVIIVEGTGTIAPSFDKDGKIIYNSRIQEFYDKGDRRKWFGPCRVCDALQWLKYENFQWPTGHMEKAVYVCERCGASHNEKQWRDFQYNARWYPTSGLTQEQEKDIAKNYSKAHAADPTVRSYWRNGFNRLLPVTKGYRTALHEIVAKGESAKTSIDALKIWKQEEAAELFDPSTEGEEPPPWKPIFNRRENYGLIVPDGGLYMTAYVDCQLNRLEVDWRAWGDNEESWGMDHVVLEGHIRDPEVWQALRIELARKWKHESGGTLSLGMSFIDGGAYQDDVYRFFQTLAKNPVPGVNGHCRASKGIGQHGHPIVTRKMMTVGKNLKGHHIGTWEAKDRLYERLRMEPVENDTREGQTHFNERYGEEFFQQLTVEQVTITFERGHEVRKYVNPKQQRNEALDLEVGNLAAFRLHPRNFETLQKELEATIPVAGKEWQKPSATPKRPRKRSEWLEWNR